jgi:hypothetical protein
MTQLRKKSTLIARKKEFNKTVKLNKEAAKDMRA